MQTDDITDLFKRYQDGKCSEEEKEILERWYLQYNEHEVELSNAQIEEFGKQIYQQIHADAPVRKMIKPWHWISAAAIILCGLALPVYLIKTKVHSTLAYQQNILPGINKAILTLANGKQINLTDASAATPFNQRGVQITKSKKGQVTYTAVVATAGAINELNTLRTPNGGQWQIKLQDGTKVWLNSASSLTYPASFLHLNNRTITLTGEAYFEVAKDRKHPFIVKTSRQSIQVLGTHFNINAYADEPETKTTLIEGSVQVSANQHEAVLKPGEQASLSSTAFSINAVDTEPVIAWKNGDFIFKNSDFNNTMRQIARWYDVEIVYESQPENFTPGGWISRSKSIGSILKIMELTGKVHFKIQGRRIVVTK